VAHVELNTHTTATGMRIPIHQAILGRFAWRTNTAAIRIYSSDFDLIHKLKVRYAARLASGQPRALEARPGPIGYLAKCASPTPAQPRRLKGNYIDEFNPYYND
jgi:hypothetical protein